MLFTELRKPIGNISETPLEHGDKDAHTLVSALGAERDAVKKRIDDERAKAESKLSTRLSRSAPRRTSISDTSAASDSDAIKPTQEQDVMLPNASQSIRYRLKLCLCTRLLRLCSCPFATAVDVFCHDFWPSFCCRSPAEGSKRSVDSGEVEIHTEQNGFTPIREAEAKSDATDTHPSSGKNKTLAATKRSHRLRSALTLTSLVHHMSSEKNSDEKAKPTVTVGSSLRRLNSAASPTLPAPRRSRRLSTIGQAEHEEAALAATKVARAKTHWGQVKTRRILTALDIEKSQAEQAKQVSFGQPFPLF